MSPQSNEDYSPPPPPPTESPPSPTAESPESPPTAELPPTTMESPTPLSPPNGGLATGVLIVLIVGIVMGVLIVIVAVGFCVIRRRKKRRRGDKIGSDGLAQGAEDQFSDANLLGEGGFGLVHKGVLPNGKEVAIKHLKSGSVQGDREFEAEVEIISRVNHKRLVSLVGYCIAGAQRMLVHEFIPNFTLYFHLHGKERPVMNWPTRMKIALGSAKGLAYLHEDCYPNIIHRDIKAANILLDDNFDAKVADFGLAKFLADTDTHVSTRVMGTFGYLAPEYAASGKLIIKSDVFSFGVVLLELITGRQPHDRNQSLPGDSMVEWVRPLLMRALENGNFDALVDPRLQNDYNSSEMSRMATCAAACVRHSARQRPRMSVIVRALEGNLSLDDLNEGIKPGHSMAFGLDYGRSQYNQADMNKFRKMALESQEQCTSESSGPA